ncbi:NAD(P)-binding protein [Polychaeton citri CBS 116435]|uniref:NAD(P)-binding protein n=1 Tax=Polychaeton citri CBS 116435 TaxID=1314669 RepID=A0A9P4UPQ0_9PEZI|nr:NAD(P)-binding protein [Polychaeton citri CBS 116435]
MANLLVIFGITGQQGSSIANKVIEDAELSRKYKVRGITRDPTKPQAKAWESKGVEVVKGDADDRESIKRALKGAHTVFLMTTSLYKPGGMEQEIAQGKAAVDEAQAAQVHFLIYSTVPSPKKLTDGQYTVSTFDCKDAVKDYIETLPIKSAFFSPGSFMQNFTTFMTPHLGPDGQLALTNFVKPETELPCVDIAGDTGKFVAAILAEPDKFAGKTMCSATRVYTLQEVVDTMSKSCGKPVKYIQVPKDVYAGFLPENMRDSVLNMWSYIELTGYYGPDSKKLVARAAENARGTPIGFDEYLQRNPLNV